MDPGSTLLAMGEKAEYTWEADWRLRDLWGEERSVDNWAGPEKLGTGRQRQRQRKRRKNWRKLQRCY